jgi:hypothetical protein
MRLLNVGSLVVVLSSAFSLHPPVLSAPIETCERRVVPVSVLSSQGRVIWGLTADNFQILTKHGAARPLAVTPDASARRVLIAIDASGSMFANRYSGEFYFRRAAALVQALPADTPVGLVTFAKTIETTVPITTDRDRVMAALEELSQRYEKKPSKGNTALWDSLRSSLQMFGTVRQSDVIYVISDGGDNASKTTAAEFTRAASPVRMFAMIPEQETQPVIELQAARPEFERAVQRLGGTSVVLRSPAGLAVSQERVDQELLKSRELPEMLANQTMQIEFYYLVEYEAANAGAKDGRLDLKVTGIGEKNPMIVYSERQSVCVE